MMDSPRAEIVSTHKIPSPPRPQSMRLRALFFFSWSTARKEQSENWRGVGLVVANDEIDRRGLTIERTAGHGPRKFFA